MVIKWTTAKEWQGYPRGSGGPTRTVTPGYPTLTGEGMEGKGIPRGVD